MPISKDIINKKPIKGKELLPQNSTIINEAKGGNFVFQNCMFVELTSEEKLIFNSKGLPADSFVRFVLITKHEVDDFLNTYILKPLQNGVPARVGFIYIKSSINPIQIEEVQGHGIDGKVCNVAISGNTEFIFVSYKNVQQDPTTAAQFEFTINQVDKNGNKTNVVNSLHKFISGFDNSLPEGVKSLGTTPTPQIIPPPGSAFENDCQKHETLKMNFKAAFK